LAKTSAVFINQNPLNKALLTCRFFFYRFVAAKVPRRYNKKSRLNSSSVALSGLPDKKRFMPSQIAGIEGL